MQGFAKNLCDHLPAYVSCPVTVFPDLTNHLGETKTCYLAKRDPKDWNPPPKNMLNKENVTYKAKANNKAKEDDSESKHMWREMERFVDAKTVCGLVWS